MDDAIVNHAFGMHFLVVCPKDKQLSEDEFRDGESNEMNFI